MHRFSDGSLMVLWFSPAEQSADHPEDPTDLLLLPPLPPPRLHPEAPPPLAQEVGPPAPSPAQTSLQLGPQCISAAASQSPGRQTGGRAANQLLPRCFRSSASCRWGRPIGCSCWSEDAAEPPPPLPPENHTSHTALLNRRREAGVLPDGAHAKGSAH